MNNSYKILSLKILHHIKKIFVLKILFFAFITHLHAFNLPRQYALVKDMQSDWLVYDAQYGVYVPYFAERHKKPNAVSFWVDLDENQHHQIVFYVQKPLFFFINGKLCTSFSPKKETWIHIKLDSLKKLYPKEKKIFCTLYDTKKNLPLSVLCLATQNPLQESNATIKTFTKADTLTRISRPYIGKDWVVLVAVFVFLVFTLLWNIYPRGLLSYLSIKSSLSPVAHKDMNLLQKPIGLSNLLLILGCCLLVAFSFWGYQMATQISAFSAITNPQSLNNIWVLGSYFYVVGIVFCLFLIKYFVFRTSGVLLNTSQSVVNTHFFEMVRLSYLFYACLFFLPLYFWVSAPQYIVLYADIYKYLLLVFHLLQSFLVSFWVFKQIEYKNLYLFYYLCTTEIVPLLFGMKWLVIN